MNEQNTLKSGTLLLQTRFTGPGLTKVLFVLATGRVIEVTTCGLIGVSEFYVSHKFFHKFFLKHYEIYE